MNEEILENQEEETTTEPQTEETVTETQEETTTTVTTTVISTSEPVDYSEGFYDYTENIIHQLFSELGVNLDYVPQNKAQAFSMALQFAAALWFIWWFVKMMYTLLRGFLTGGTR